MYGPPVAFHFYNHSIIIDEEMCTGCFDCIRVCAPKKVIGAKKVEGKKKAFVQNPDECIGCMKCYNTCLVKAITTVKTPKQVEKD